MKIIVDAFGGDHAPKAVVEGCMMAVKELGVNIILTGDKEKIEAVIAENNGDLTGIEIVHAETVMPVNEESTKIMKEYSNSSLAVGLKLLADGSGDAFVSAGSTGALVVGSSLIVKRLKGVKRAAIGTLIPTIVGRGSYMLLDAGANHECRPEMLVQFGIMGSAYMNKLVGVAKPKVGLVNIGAEETKGIPLYVAAHEQLKTAPLNFIGNIEARGLPMGECDVAVADGFTGNIILKLTEGMGKSISIGLKEMFTKSLKTKLAFVGVSDGLAEFKKKMDYTEAGGAPLLGLTRPVIKAHGSSNAYAFKNAIKQAKLCCENDVIGEIARALRELKIANPLADDE